MSPVVNIISWLRSSHTFIYYLVHVYQRRRIYERALYLFCNPVLHCIFIKYIQCIMIYMFLQSTNVYTDVMKSKYYTSTNCKVFADAILYLYMPLLSKLGNCIFDAIQHIYCYFYLTEMDKLSPTCSPEHVSVS